MLSWQYYGPEKINFENIKERNLNKDEVRLGLIYSSINGTDCKTYLRGHPKIIKTIPSDFGYEYLGRITESLNPKFKQGQIVVGANTAPCLECQECKKNLFELCDNLDFLNGAFAESLIIPARIANHNLYSVDPEDDLINLTMTQTLAVTLLGLERSSPKLGESIMVIGLGPIGQSFVKLFKKFYTQNKLIAISSSDFKLNLAYSNGADKVINYKQEKIQEKADLIIEASGQENAWLQALDLIKPGGRINFFGGLKKGTIIPVDSYKLHYEEISLVGSFHHRPTNIQAAIKLLAKSEIDLKDLLSHEIKLENLQQGLDLMIQGKALKVLIRHQA